MMKEMFDLVHMHTNFDKELYTQVQNEHPVIVQNCASAPSRKLYAMQREVLKSIERARKTLVFEQSLQGIYYATYIGNHAIVPYVLQFFHGTLPTSVIAIAHQEHTYVIDPTGILQRYPFTIEETLSLLGKTLPLEDLMQDFDFVEKISPYST